ncbi:hypothetical protein BDV41DRAFT_578124 [Aspergillus transmontanensis]|uniref:Ricin B lectin domain-containing protein n=1 Tax=Aspergillus transmontanensis TaxID=1034304 RepID=A0A5N6VTX0_9EURO|nr:hypothetical protein BDV41DRAFT_578124 [Aspergillus transmontanensis]
MKTLLTLATLAAFCQSAFGLTGGNYQIKSGALLGSPVLSDFSDISDRLLFSPNIKSAQQTWTFSPTDNKGEFLIQSLSGNYINCGSERGSDCFPGEEQEIYAVEQVSDNGYGLVSKRTGYFLSAGGLDLRVAEYAAGSPEQAFILGCACNKLAAGLDEIVDTCGKS